MKRMISSLLLIPGLAMTGTLWASTPSPSTTTLALSSSAVSKDTAVMLTATVNAGGKAISPGLVLFCDATAKYCEDTSILGTAQLASTGTASINLRLGIGTHSIKAVFVGTDEVSASSSEAESLTVTGKNSTTSTISVSGNSGNYTLSATVAGIGNSTAGPTGEVSFVDPFNSHIVLSNATLGLSTLTQGFATPVSYVTGNTPAAVATGDFNGDGRPDLAVANQNGASSFVGVFLGKGDGTFQPQVTYPTGNTPAAVAVGDFNSDGKLDLVTANRADNSVSILLGNGDGTFQPEVAYPVGSLPLSVAVGDFNGDGNPDLVAVNWSDNTVSALLGKGDGSFQPQVTYPTGNAPYSVAVTDFNRDGKQDIVVANSQDTTVGVFLGNGDGTFKTQMTYNSGVGRLGGLALSVAVGDFNGDGNPDLAAANRDGANVGVLLGNGDGTFQTVVTYSQQLPAYVVVADFNGDGKPDLAIANEANPMSVLLNKGDGTFLAGGSYDASGNPNWLAAGDFNGDSHPDLAVIDTDANHQGSSLGILLDQIKQTTTATAIHVNGDNAQYVYAHYSGDSNFFGSDSCQIGLNTSPSTPIISGLTVSNITATAATISWSTNVAAYGGVNYGLSTVGLTSTTPWTAPVSTMHSFTLTGLTPGSTYDYQAWSVSFFSGCNHWSKFAPAASFTTARAF